MTVEVKQCDREAAAKFISETDGDFPELAGLFARHRIQSELSFAGLSAERKRTRRMTWLRRIRKRFIDMLETAFNERNWQ